MRSLRKRALVRILLVDIPNIVAMPITIIRIEVIIIFFIAVMF